MACGQLNNTLFSSAEEWLHATQFGFVSAHQEQFAVRNCVGWSTPQRVSGVDKSTDKRSNA